jgi:hypothetical protein
MARTEFNSSKSNQDIPMNRTIKRKILGTAYCNGTLFQHEIKILSAATAVPYA